MESPLHKRIAVLAGHSTDPGQLRSKPDLTAPTFFVSGSLERRLVSKGPAARRLGNYGQLFRLKGRIGRNYRLSGRSKMKVIHIAVIAAAIFGALPASAQSGSGYSSGSVEGRSDSDIRANAPNASTATERLENKAPADSTQKSQGGQASPTAESK